VIHVAYCPMGMPKDVEVLYSVLMVPYLQTILLCYLLLLLLFLHK